MSFPNTLFLLLLPLSSAFTVTFNCAHCQLAQGNNCISMIGDPFDFNEAAIDSLYSSCAHLPHSSVPRLPNLDPGRKCRHIRVPEDHDWSRHHHNNEPFLRVDKTGGDLQLVREGMVWC